MKVIAKVKGVETELELKQSDDPKHDGITAAVLRPGMKLSAPSAYEISIETTTKCMKDMNQKAWEHISGGELFQHLFKLLFQDDAYIPKTIEELNDEDKSVIHGAGLIIQLVEARFDRRPEVFVRTPEDSFHPKQCQRLMSVIKTIQQIPMGGDMNVTTSSPTPPSGDLDYEKAINNAVRE